MDKKSAHISSLDGPHLQVGGSQIQFWTAPEKKFFFFFLLMRKKWPPLLNCDQNSRLVVRWLEGNLLRTGSGLKLCKTTAEKLPTLVTRSLYKVYTASLKVEKGYLSNCLLIWIFVLLLELFSPPKIARGAENENPTKFEPHFCSSRAMWLNSLTHG